MPDMNLEQLAKRAQEVADELDELAAIETLDEEQDARFDELVEEADELRTSIAKAEKRAAAVKDIKEAATRGNVEHGDDRSAPQFIKPVATDVDWRSASRDEARSAALKIVERDGERTLAARQLDNVDKLIGTRNGNTNGDYIARRLLITESDEYRSAFVKAMHSATPWFTEEEGRAVQALRDLEAREMSGGTTTAGGFGVPVLNDPSIILTSGASGVPILDAARQVTITTDAWKGVSSAGVTASYDSELAEVSDDSPTLAQPSVDVYTARAWVPYSIEVGEDYPSFAAEMSRLINA
ncbi:MAG: hypothetical protein KJN63_08640, partial [Acidimicrobiia bacterium]|nr:hypothetical protein [Acidimicrobiia bacterium]